MNKPTCSEVMKHICDNLDDDLQSPKCAEIKAHLENCDSCTKYFHSVESTIEFYKKYNVNISEEVHTRLIKFLNLGDNIT